MRVFRHLYRCTMAGLVLSCLPAVVLSAPDYGKLPLRFEPNVGQAPASVKYLARGHGYLLELAQDGLILNVRGGEVGRQLKLTPVNAGVKPGLRGERRQESVSNFFLGKDPAKWRRNVANYAAVRYEQIYPGIDWVIYGNPQRPEYDFVVAAGSDPGQIRLKIAGAHLISLAANGDLLVDLDGQTLRQLKPRIYQVKADRSRHEIDGRYVVDHDRLAFAIGRYDPNVALIIDPVISYSTYLGGSSGDEANAIAVDSAGAAYVAGLASSPDFPTAHAFQGTNGNGSAFVSKFNLDGTALIYSTYLGGDFMSGATAIRVDSSGDVYVTGYTFAGDFPTLNAIQATRPGEEAAFVTKLNATGSALVYSTYLGGATCVLLGVPVGGYSGKCGATEAHGIAIDGAGNAYVTGWTTSIDFPTVNPFKRAYAGFHGFVSKLNASGSALVYSTYLGGSGVDVGNGIAVDSTGDAYVTGQTSSTDFPTLNPIQGAKLGETASFVTKLDNSGGRLVYSTYLGGSGIDQGYAISVDSAGDAYVAGRTSSTDFPTVGAIQSKNNSSWDTAFVAKLNVAGNALAYSTYLGGSGGDSANAITVDDGGHAYVAGKTTSTDFPLSNALQRVNNASTHNGSNAFVSVLNAAGSSLDFSTYLGGTDSAPAPCVVPAIAPTTNLLVCYGAGDSANGVALDDSGGIYVAGSADSTDFPLSQPFQSVNKAANGAPNAFVTKISALLPVGSRHGGGAMGWGVIDVLGVLLAVQIRRRVKKGAGIRPVLSPDRPHGERGGGGI